MKFSTACLALAAVAAVTTVDAYSGDLGRLPHSKDDNNIFNKDLGHPGGNTGQKTKFAQDLRSVGNTWPQLCEIDSDGDNKTNGEELGDPCCQWIKSGYEMPEIFPANDLSNPNDAGDTTNLAKPGTCPAPPAKIVRTPAPAPNPTPEPEPVVETPVVETETPVVETETPVVETTETETVTEVEKPNTIHQINGGQVEIEGGGNGSTNTGTVQNGNLQNGAAAGLYPAVAATIMCVVAALL